MTALSTLARSHRGLAARLPPTPQPPCTAPTVPACPLPHLGHSSERALSHPWRNSPAAGPDPPDPHPRCCRIGAHSCTWALGNPRPALWGGPGHDVQHRPPLSSPRCAGWPDAAARVCSRVLACAHVCVCVQALAALVAAVAQPVGGAGDGAPIPVLPPVFRCCLLHLLGQEFAVL